MNRAKFITIFIILCCFFFPFHIQADESDKMEKAMSAWMHWKVAHIQDHKKKEIITYLENISPLYHSCRETTFVTEKSDYGIANPKKAINTINASLKKIQLMKVPSDCQHYHEIILQVIEKIKQYHELRVKYGDTELLWENAKNLKLEITKQDAERVKEHHLILDNIGFYDTMLEEMRQLNLISQNELEEARQP